MPVTVVVGGDARQVDGDVRGETLLLTPEALLDVTGWELRGEGLCRGDVCIPRRADDQLVSDGRVDIVAFGAALRRPVAVEPEAGIAVLAASADSYQHVIDEGSAPPFTLPDLDGDAVSLADFRGRKKLLLAWSSW